MRHVALTLCLALAACGKQPAEPAASEAAPAGAPAAAAAAAPASGEGYVTAVTPLRRAASEAPRVPGPSGKDVSNFLATLHRGEAVAVLEAKDDWVKVRSSGDTEGWLRRTAVIDGAGVTLATTVAEVDLFDRPELLAQNRKLAPGTLVFVVKTRTPFSEVNVSGAQHAWVLAERLTSEARQIEIAKLTEKARWQVKSGKAEDALRTLEIARTHFAAEPLVASLAVELGAAPPADPAAGVVVPAAGTLPAEPAAGAAPAQP